MLNEELLIFQAKSLILDLMIGLEKTFVPLKI